MRAVPSMRAQAGEVMVGLLATSSGLRTRKAAG